MCVWLSICVCVWVNSSKTLVSIYLSFKNPYILYLAFHDLGSKLKFTRAKLLKDLLIYFTVIEWLITSPMLFIEISNRQYEYTQWIRSPVLYFGYEILPDVKGWGWLQFYLFKCIIGCRNYTKMYAFVSLWICFLGVFRDGSINEPRKFSSVVSKVCLGEFGWMSEQVFY